jgi:hypothetical protein
VVFCRESENGKSREVKPSCNCYVGALLVRPVI